MPFAATHILAGIILIELYREFFIKDNKKFPRYYILIAAFGSIIPDLDFAFVYILYPLGFTINQLHKTFLHTVFIPLTLLLIGIFLYEFKIKNSEFGKKHLTLHTTFFILAATNLLHLILDGLITPIMPFYPISKIYIGLNILKIFPIGIRDLILPTFDGILILFWILWMEFKLKVSDYF